ncbi:MAG: hypothetical protein R3D81_14930 [Thalassovita sp.]
MPSRIFLTAAGIRAGDYAPRTPAVIAQREMQAKAQAERKERQAMNLWNEAQPIQEPLQKPIFAIGASPAPLPIACGFIPRHGTPRRNASRRCWPA